MILYLSMQEVVEMHKSIIASTGGATGIRDVAALESSLALPQTKYFGNEQYPTITEKAGILGFSIIKNHPFIDGNKRIGQMSMEAFLMFNGYELDATATEQENVILSVAAGKIEKEEFIIWLDKHIIPSDN